MNAQPESEQLQNFHNRLSKWVSGQGFWFQLRYSLSGKGGKGTLSFHLLWLSARIVVFLLILAGGFVLYIAKQSSSISFQEGVEASFMQKLEGEKIEMKGLMNSHGKFAISNLAMTGKDGSFFTELEMHYVKCKRGFFSNFQKEWDPGVVSISKVDMGLRAGADSLEAAESMANVFFQDTDNLKLENIVVKDISVRWGYSERTRGSINGSYMTASRLPDGWELRFKGGVFSQNWLRRLTIEEIVVQCGRKGLVIEKAIFKKNEGLVTLLDVKVAAGDRPEVSGKMRVQKLDISSIVPLAARNYVEGKISAEFNVFGSTNSIDGIGFEGDLVLEEKNFISIRDRIHVFRAISVIDPLNSYKRIDFREGSFHMRTHAGRLEIADAFLKAGDLFSMKGNMTVRAATTEEANAYTNAKSKDEMILDDDEMDSKRETNLKDADGQVEDKKNRQRIAKAGDESLFEKFRMNVENRRLDGIRAERLSRSMHYEGEFEVSLPKEAFDKAPKLSEMYPLRDSAGRILMKVPLEGLLDKLSLKQAEEIFKNGAR